MRRCSLFFKRGVQVYAFSLAELDVARANQYTSINAKTYPLFYSSPPFYRHTRMKLRFLAASLLSILSYTTCMWDLRHLSINEDTNTLEFVISPGEGVAMRAQLSFKDASVLELFNVANTGKTFTLDLASSSIVSPTFTCAFRLSNGLELHLSNVSSTSVDIDIRMSSTIADALEHTTEINLTSDPMQNGELRFPLPTNDGFVTVSTASKDFPMSSKLYQKVFSPIEWNVKPFYGVYKYQDTYYYVEARESTYSTELYILRSLLSPGETGFPRLREKTRSPSNKTRLLMYGSSALALVGIGCAIYYIKSRKTDSKVKNQRNNKSNLPLKR